jgi:hypothetical protein
MISDEGLLYIEPTQPASAEPVLDHLTRKMAAAFRKARLSEWGSRGFHECVCGALSTSRDYRLPNGEVTNSLCVHYVAHHRSEVPAGHLARIKAFTFGEVEPPAEQLQGPEVVLARVRARVENWLGANRLNTWTGWGLVVDGLSRNLRGGCLPAEQRYSPARSEAEDLLTLLSSIKADELSCVKAAVEQDHGDMRQWGQQALRIPGWDRGLWVSPLLALFQWWCKGMGRREAVMNLRYLRPVSQYQEGAALLELAKREAGDRDYQHDLSLVLTGLAEVLGVSLAPQIPPRLGLVGTCGYCNGSGDCYCKRKGMASSDQCVRCNGSGKCHLCKGTGRLTQ